MGGNFLEFMKSIGIFILCAQSFMYFTAGKSYEKYVKLLIGVMILAQFTMKLWAIFPGGENDRIWENIERFQRELDAAVQEAEQDMATSFGQDIPWTEAELGCWTEGTQGGWDVFGAKRPAWSCEKAALEAELAKRLEVAAVAYGVEIEEVELKGEPLKIVVAVCMRTENALTEGGKEVGKERGVDKAEEGIGKERENGEGAVAGGTIKIEKIAIEKGGVQEMGGGLSKDESAITGKLAEVFAQALGTDASYIEVYM